MLMISKTKICFIIFLCIVGVSLKRTSHSFYVPRKILGGSLAQANDMLYVLSMEVRGYFACGASAIGTYWAVTAAHCVDEGVLPKDIVLRSGSKEKYEGVPHQVITIIIHPEYGPIVRNDIAVLKVKEPFFVSKTSSFIQLIGQDYSIEDNVELIVAGWGKTQTGRYSEYLKRTKVRYMTNSRCQRMQRYESSFVLTDNMLCAYTEGQDSAQGDSGGPLVLRKDNQDFLVGIVSWGEGKGMLTGPGIYVRVSKFTNWILSVTQEDNPNHVLPVFTWSRNIPDSLGKDMLNPRVGKGYNNLNYKLNVTKPHHRFNGIIGKGYYRRPIKTL